MLLLLCDIINVEEMRKVYKVLVRKSEGKESLQRPRHSWKGNIKMDHKEKGCEGVDWIQLTQDRVWSPVNIVMNL
jgi:hypothetical protein